MVNHRNISHAAFGVMMNEFLTKADGNAARYGLTQILIDKIKDNRNNLTAAVDLQALKKAESKAATTALNGTRRTSDDDYAEAKRTAKESGVAAEILAEINFAPDDASPTPIGVVDPTELSVVGFSNGKNSLVFRRNSNKEGTIYVVEAKIGEATTFGIVGFTKTDTFHHKNQKPGVKVVYRVRAERGDQVSDYSNEAVIYGD